jgi:hypothetical protein
MPILIPMKVACDLVANYHYVAQEMELDFRQAYIVPRSVQSRVEGK